MLTVDSLKHKSDCLHLELISENRAAVEQEVKQGCILLSSSVPDSYKGQWVQDTGIWALNKYQPIYDIAAATYFTTPTLPQVFLD